MKIIIKNLNKQNKKSEKHNDAFRSFILILIFIFNITFLLTNVDRTKIMTRTEALIRGKKFMGKCFDGIFMNRNNNKIIINPKISTIIPIYNSEKTIKPAIRSIQNQDMEDIEIILIDDNSNDTTLSIIQELSKEDRRIKIFRNKINKGTLYSRNIGVLNSKAKYIMNLDNDDLFLDVDIFDTVYKEAEINNYDIVGFAAVQSYTYFPLIPQIEESPFHDHKDGLIVFQPNLTYFAISRKGKYSPNDYHIWGKLIRSDLYKFSLNNFGLTALGELRNESFLTWAEDCSILMAIFRYAKSYKFIKKYGIFHYLSITTASYTSKKYLKRYGELFFLDSIFDFSHDNIEGKKYSIQMANEVIFKHISNLYNSKNEDYLKAILNKMIKCKYFSSENKTKLQEISESLNKIKVN